MSTEYECKKRRHNIEHILYTKLFFPHANVGCTSSKDKNLIVMSLLNKASPIHSKSSTNNFHTPL